MNLRASDISEVREMSIRWTVGAMFILMMIATGCATTKLMGQVSAGTSQSANHTADNSATNSTSNASATNADHTELTSMIQRYYANHHEKILQSYPNTDGILVEWDFGDPTIASRYDWWDAKTDQRIDVPTNTDFTKVLSASSTDVRLVTTGPNSIDSSLTFPYIIDDTRGSSADAAPFQMEKRPYFLELPHQIKFGAGKLCVMTTLIPTLDGLQASFGPVPGKEVLFESGAPACPTMETSYDSKTHAFTIRFLNTTLSNAAKRSASNLLNEYVTSALAVQSGSDTLLHLKLTSDCTNYNGQQGHLYDLKENPYVTFHFANKVEWTYPTIEEQTQTSSQ
jgi:hypothetical protein